MNPHTKFSRLALFCVLLIASTAPAQAPKPDPLAARLRAVAGAAPQFSAYVFSGETFPAGSLAPGSGVEQYTGPLTLHSTFYDAEYRPVTRAEKPGIYAAVVEMRPAAGRALRRFVTLFRTAGPVAADTPLGPDQLAALGLDRAAVQRQETLIRETLKDRPFRAWSRDPQAARLLAGLARSSGEEGPVAKWEDAFAQERQWWVGFKRHLYGWDKAFPRPFVAPTPIEGEAARVVREGTPAEAGVKPETAAKIDAACRAFAADTDEAFAICVVRHGVIVIHKAYGTRAGKPMTVETKSWMASITKSMSASLMMMVVDRGLLSLDEPLDRFLPLRGNKAQTPLTLRHLYTHTNGLQAMSGDDRIPDGEERIADCYAELPVGKAWVYNGGGYVLGGKILEAISGETVPHFYHQHLLEPLGCIHTDVIGTHADAYSTPLDIARFGQMLLNRGAYGKWRFFRPETFAQMLPQRLTKTLGPDAKKTFGLGLDGGVAADGKVATFGHGAASAATFHVDRDNDMVVIMTRNKYGKNQDKYNGPIWDAIKSGLVK